MNPEKTVKFPGYSVYIPERLFSTFPCYKNGVSHQEAPWRDITWHAFHIECCTTGISHGGSRLIHVEITCVGMLLSDMSVSPCVSLGSITECRAIAWAGNSFYEIACAV